jgi:hypothetical protein
MKKMANNKIFYFCYKNLESKHFKIKGMKSLKERRKPNNIIEKDEEKLLFRKLS